MTSPINICRPGFGASCSLCCGSHNYRAGHGEIEALFVRRARIMKAYSRDFLVRKMIAFRSSMTGSYYADHSDGPFDPALPALFQDCPQCPFVGFVEKGNITGCLLGGADGPSELRHECFLTYRGKVFICPARESLADEGIIYAARLTRDWYYYSILIHEPELLRGLMQECPGPEEVPAARRERLERELERRISMRRELHAIHGYFS